MLRELLHIHLIQVEGVPEVVWDDLELLLVQAALAAAAAALAAAEALYMKDEQMIGVREPVAVAVVALLRKSL